MSNIHTVERGGQLTAEVVVAQLLAHNEDNRVVAVAATGVAGNRGWLVDDYHIFRVSYHLNGSTKHRVLVPGITQQAQK